MNNKKVCTCFIGGCDRSGTTMLGSMLGSLKGVCTTPESQFVWDVYKHYDVKNLNANEISHLINNHWRFKVWKSKPSVFDTIKVDYTEIVFQYVKKYNQDKPYTYWIDHTPESLSNHFILKDIFQNIKYIHIVRDGRAILSSFKKLNWGPNTPYAAANWWNNKLAPCLALESSLPNNQILRVYYEDLIERSETTIRQICEFLGLTFQDSSLTTGGFIPPQYTQKQHKLVSNGKTNSSRVGAWKNELTTREIELFEHYSSGTLTSLGYEIVSDKNFTKPSKRESIQSSVYEKTASLLNYTKQKYRIFRNV